MVPEEQHNEAGKLVDDLQQEMLRIAKEIGHLKEENRGLKKLVFLAEDTALPIRRVSKPDNGHTRRSNSEKGKDKGWRKQEPWSRRLIETTNTGWW